MYINPLEILIDLFICKESIEDFSVHDNEIHLLSGE